MEVTSEGVPVTALIGAVKDSLKKAAVSNGDGDSDLRMESVQLVLNVVATESAGGGLDFRVPFIGMKLSVGAKVTRQDTHRIDITLVPPPPDPDYRETRGDIETALVDAITTIRGVMASAAEGDEPWVLSTSEVEISFVVTKEGSISLGAEGEFANEVTNKLLLVLKPR
jgi:NTP-dependent ternary system trypsin peptidase co-occuring protein